MADDQPPFYSPNRGPAPSRQPKPGEQVWRLQHDGRVQSCELRDDSKAGAGWDVQLFEDGELLFSRRCADERAPGTSRRASNRICSELDGPKNLGGNLGGDHPVKGISFAVGLGHTP
jgi:hypothetical protein